MAERAGRDAVTAADMAAARVVMARCDLLAGYSEEPGCLTRRYGTPALRAAHDAVAEWLRAAGMAVRRDAIGNLIGRYASASETAPTLLLGSHLDTVRDAGKYDGPLGVLVSLACVADLHALGERLPFAVEVIAFADEEGLRYHSTYLGSRVMAGTFDPDDLDLTDADGIPLAEAIRAFGGDPNALPAARRDPRELLGYCEVHIEQGPVLEARGLPVGAVSAIAGQSRHSVTFSGMAGHAGTVPMDLRRDALCVAAEFVLAVERTARGEEGLVATVGQLAVRPGASNVIPGQVILSLDLRHQNDAIHAAARASLQSQARQLAATREVTLDWQTVHTTPAVACAPHLTALLAQAIDGAGFPVLTLPSGAGHDAAALAALTPVAMLFMRCQGGVSHHPAEAVQTADVAAAIAVLRRFLTMLTR